MSDVIEMGLAFFAACLALGLGIAASIVVVVLALRMLGLIP